MSEDKIRYDVLASEALRGIIRTVLQRVQKRGLPGDHHFYIAFDTQAAGVILSKRLRERYPLDMTIVLQHKFWDLVVFDDRFEVKLSFNNVPERLVIPLAAIKSFVDPSVQFGFNPNLFAPAVAEGDPVPAGPVAAPSEPARGAERLVTPSSALPAQPERSALPRPAPAARQTNGAAVSEPEEIVEQEEQPDLAAAKVVKLDLFRKK